MYFQHRTLSGESTWSVHLPVRYITSWHALSTWRLVHARCDCQHTNEPLPYLVRPSRRERPGATKRTADMTCLARHHQEAHLYLSRRCNNVHLHSLRQASWGARTPVYMIEDTYKNTQNYLIPMRVTPQRKLYCSPVYRQQN